MRRYSVAARAAFLTVAANGIASLFMLAVLRHGIPAGESSLDARIAYIREHTAAWRAGWLSWNLAAMTLIVFYAAVALRWRRDAPLRCAAAVAFAAAGLTADLAGESILSIVSPGLARADFGTVESIAIVLTGFVANGLYTVAGILLTWAAARELPRALVVLGAAAWAAGLGLSAATLARSTTGEFVSSLVLMPLFILWALGVGLWLRDRAS